MQDVKTINKDELLLEDTYLAIEEMDELEKVSYKAMVRSRAKDVGVSVKIIDEMFKAAEKMIQQDYYRFRKEQTRDEIELERNEKGVPAPTLENFLRILRKDPFFDAIHFNELSNCPEWHEADRIRRWTDTDDARARHHIERHYGISNTKKYEDAIRLIFEERCYHPIKDLIESFEWDGRPRISSCLYELLDCENTPYTAEVSRLIFAGGINRIYRPGCKFDDVPVLIGTNQGEGKSTFCRWLALDDVFFREVGDIDGQRGMEAIEGGWICELSELLALTKTKEVEAVKSYLTRQSDHYRKPYDKHTSEVPRQCIFIGTTNRAQFLTDKSGNRRFYPVVVHSNGYDLLAHERECLEFIRQCWAEALALYKQDQLPAYANRELIDEIRENQSAAAEDDYREGIISEWIQARWKVCIADVWYNGLGNYSDPSRKDSNEIAQILTNLGWVRSTKSEHYNSEFGTQRVWTKPPKNEQKTDQKTAK